MLLLLQLRRPLAQRRVARGSPSLYLRCELWSGLYTASTLYHCRRTGSGKGRMALRKYDHASIYCLIAGTYTPICRVALRT